MNADHVTVIHGDSREKLKALAAGSVDSCVCDPPYALVSIVKRLGSPTAKAFKGDVYRRSGAGFMGKTWDTGETAFDPDFWREVWRVLKPGAWVVAFGGTRTVGQLQVAIETAGFEIRDEIANLIDSDARASRFADSLDEEQFRAFVQLIDDARPGGMLAWLYGSGFPKSHDTERAIAVDTCRFQGRHFKRALPKASERQKHDHICDPTAASKPWEGWGTALKPALEPIILARKPLDGTVAANVLKHGTGALNIDGCRVTTDESITAPRIIALGSAASGVFGAATVPGVYAQHDSGRWPANVVHDGSEEVVAAFPANAGAGGPASGPALRGQNQSVARGQFNGLPSNQSPAFHGDSGSAARFFYSAKADADDRIGSSHPTVKPVDLMAWLCRLVTPPGGVVLDPFAGSGTTGEAALREGFRAILIEREAQYVADIDRRIAAATGAISRACAKAERHTPAKRAGADLPLFGGVADVAETGGDGAPVAPSETTPSPDFPRTAMEGAEPCSDD